VVAGQTLNKARRSGFVFPGWARAFSTALLLILGCIVSGGCAKTRVITDPILGPDFQATNVFRKEAMLPAQVRRVAILPVTSDAAGATGVAGREMLEPVLHTELVKAGRFDLAVVEPGQLQKWTGKERWDYQRPVPKDFLERIGRETGADGVIFARLTRFHAYPPMVIGWRMTLVTLDADILWSVDEVFDAAEEAVSNSARRYERGRVRNNPVLEDSRSILLSPSKFGQYTIRTAVGTLPVR
jgi:hypothetical protein